MRKPFKDHKKNISDDELFLVKILMESPKTMKEMFSAGLKIKITRIYCVLIKLEQLGFLFYEESYENNATKVRYGLAGVREGSFAERFLKGNANG